MKIADLKAALLDSVSLSAEQCHEAYGELTLEVPCGKIHAQLKHLQHDERLAFDTLIDICAVDYLHYGQADWDTQSVTTSGFSRATEPQKQQTPWTKPRFAVVYHLLSTKLNHRLRVKTFLNTAHLALPSACDIWPAANWFEREAYDLYGILFENHPDLRRILTDYGFIGHPFRKDFPLSGHVEVRYDATVGHVIYEPVDIQPRVNVPKVIRQDNRYIAEGGENK